MSWRSHPWRRAKDEVSFGQRAIANEAVRTSAFRTWYVISVENGPVKYALCDTGAGPQNALKIKLRDYIPAAKESVRVLLHNGDISMAEIVGQSSFRFSQAAEDEEEGGG